VLKIPGVTVVDPSLESWDAQPLHLPGASPSQTLAGPVATAAVAGGPMAVVGMGALVGVAAAELLTAGGGTAVGRHIDPDHVGELDPYIVDAMTRLEESAGQPPCDEPATS
jgi:hypothetical protein